MKTTILILAANPTDTARLRLDEEEREIKNGLDRAKHRKKFRLHSKGAVRRQDLRQAMLDHNPNIVHFCGHGGGEDGIAFEGVEGNTQLIPTDALAGLFELFNEDNQIQCVLLNACYSEVQARAISRHIPYVIGMNKAIGDKAAIEFSVSFYDAIGAGKSIEFAYKLGCNAIQMANIPEHLTPVLKQQKDFNTGHQPTAHVAQQATDDKTITFHHAENPQQLDAYVIDNLKNALYDHGYTISINHNLNRSIRRKKQDNRQLPTDILFVSANNLPATKNILTEHHPVIIQIGTIEELDEALQTALSNIPVLVWNNPDDNKLITQQVIEQLTNPSTRKVHTETQSEQRDAAIDTHPNTPDLWLSFQVDIQNDMIVANWLESDTGTTTKTLSSQLLPFTGSPEQLKHLSAALLGETEDWQKYLQEKLQNNTISHWQEASIRIRVMTDNPQLGMIPWHTMETSHDTQRIVETGPLLMGDQSNFISQSITTPLLAIPSNPDFGINGNIHYRITQEYLHSYLDIQGIAARVYNPAELKREILFQQPDMLYIYAKCEQGNLQLDTDYSGASTVSLQTLASWIEEAEIRPFIVLSLIGNNTPEYPEALIKNSRMLWIQQAKRLSRQDDLSNNLADILNGLANQSDIISLILKASQNHQYDLKNYLWVNGRSPNITVGNDDTRPTRQLRAALLKVMLGRGELKQRMFGEIYKSEMLNNSAFLIYVISGDEMSCPFDFPAQLQQRLQWDDSEHYLPVIPFYFHIDMNEKKDAFETIDIALSQGILHGSTDIAYLFQEELERRGLTHQDCCISLNWLIRVPSDLTDKVAEWLPVWTEILCSDFAHAIPERTVLVSAACLQVSDQVDNVDNKIENDQKPQLLQNLQRLQDTANRSLRKESQCPLGLIHIPEALGKLKSYEIDSFFRDNKDWRARLQLDENGIDTYDYAEWLFNQERGEFDATVRLVWRQFQQNYQSYQHYLAEEDA